MCSFFETTWNCPLNVLLSILKYLKYLQTSSKIHLFHPISGDISLEKNQHFPLFPRFFPGKKHAFPAIISQVAPKQCRGKVRVLRADPQRRCTRRPAWWRGACRRSSAFFDSKKTWDIDMCVYIMCTIYIYIMCNIYLWHIHIHIYIEREVSQNGGSSK